jgi:hypothetical protein
VLDFENNRVRKEFVLTRPITSNNPDGPPQFVKDESTVLFESGNYSWIHNWTGNDGKPVGSSNAEARWRQNVTLYKHMSHAFVLWPDDLPLLWWAGGVTGYWPNPQQLTRLDSADRFSYHATVTFSGRPCVLLRTPDQGSSRAVCEFWVDIVPPHPILRMRCIGDNGECDTEIQVAYQDDAHQLLPANWSIISYPPLEMRTYTVERFEWNANLPEYLFKVDLKPGMGVWDAEKGKKYFVDQRGELAPYTTETNTSLSRDQPVQFRGQTVLISVGTGIIAALFAWLAWHYRNKRLK